MLGLARAGGSWRGPAAAASLVVLLWAIPVVAFVLVRNDGPAAERQATTARPATFVRVGSRSESGTFAATISVTQSEPQQILAVRPGIVTWVNTSAVGKHVSDGMPLVSIAGQKVLCHVGSIPFYRPLTEGDHGPDVAELNGLLARSGLLVSASTEQFDTRTADAVRALQGDGDWPVTGVFSPDMTAFVPPKFGILASFAIGLGGTSGAGQPVATSTPTSAGVAIASADPTTPVDVGSGPVVLSAGTATLTITAIRPTQSEFQKIADFLNAGVASGAVTLAQPATGSQPGQYTGVTVARENPPAYGSVPASAVYSTQAGSSCVFVRADDGQPLRAVSLPASIGLSSEIGVANVPADLVGRLVVVDAAALDPKVTQQCR